MATVREGYKTALVVVDVQVGVMENAWDSARIIQNINSVVAKARHQGIPVVWVQHADDELIYGNPEWQLAPELAPAEGDIHIYKGFNSSFEQTELEEKLAKLGITHLVLAGAATNWCVRATAYGALDRGYDLTVVKDAHTTGSLEFEDGTKISAADIILELNVAMKWLSYPGRVNTTATAADLTFSA